MFRTIEMIHEKPQEAHLWCIVQASVNVKSSSNTVKLTHLLTPSAYSQIGQAWIIQIVSFGQVVNRMSVALQLINWDGHPLRSATRQLLNAMHYYLQPTGVADNHIAIC